MLTPAPPPAPPIAPRIAPRIAVVYATLGRPDLIRRTIDHLAGQIRRPDLVFVSVTKPEDAAGVEACALRPEVVLGPIGSCRQRNTGIDAVGDRADVIVFFDDDFLPAPDYLAEVEALFAADPALVGATGRIAADGIKTPGYSFEDGLRLLREDRPPSEPRLHPSEALYGCNMIVRVAALGDIRFDERLPFYGWLEDIDLTYRLGRRGRMVKNDRMAGVHLGVKGGRTSGLRFGYSQIANPIYMLRKRSAPPRLAWRMMTRNLASNLVHSLRPEPYVDRAGRLRGNLRALADLLRGRLDPTRIIDMG